MRRTAPTARTALAPAWSRDFPAVPEQAREARRYLAAILDGQPGADDAILCLAELVANAISHSRSREPGGTFTVRVRHAGAGGRLRIEVDDQGGAWRPRSRGDGQHGHGLSIVAELAAGWGILATPAGRTIWFETKAGLTPGGRQHGTDRRDRDRAIHVGIALASWLRALVLDWRRERAGIDDQDDQIADIAVELSGDAG